MLDDARKCRMCLMLTRWVPCMRRFAASLGRGEELRGALLRLDAQNRSAQNVDRLFSLFHHSHPALVERLAALDGALARGAGSGAAKKAE